MQIQSNLIEAHIVRFVDNKIEYLLLKRSKHEKYPNIWQMVTGKIKANEKAFEAAIREVLEETQLNFTKLFVVPHVNSFYNEIDDTTNFVPVFVGLVEPELEVILSDEHQEYKWVKKKEAKRLLAWPGQSKSVDFIHDCFIKKITNLNFIEILLD